MSIRKRLMPCIVIFIIICRLKRRISVPLKNDGEARIQNLLVQHTKKYFPKCDELLLWEQDIIENYSQYGKCDLIFLRTDGKIAVIETKYLDLNSTGKSHRNKRNKKRRNVRKQVIDRIDTLSRHYIIPKSLFVAIIATNDPGFKTMNSNIKHIYVEILP